MTTDDIQSEHNDTGTLEEFLEAFWERFLEAVAVQHFSPLEPLLDPELAVLSIHPPRMQTGPEFILNMLQMVYGYDLELPDYEISAVSFDLATFENVAVDSGLITNRWIDDGSTVARSIVYTAVFRRANDLGWRLYRMSVSDKGLFSAFGRYYERT